QEKALDIVKASKTIFTPYNIISDAKITSNSQIEIYDQTKTYAQRLVTASGITYIQGGKSDKDVTDQKMMLSGWYGTPLTSLRFNMANQVNPQVSWGSSSHDIYHAGNRPTSMQEVSLSNTSCNEAIESGFYSIFTGTTDTPFGAGPSGSQLIVAKWGNSGVSQTFYTYNSDRVFVRRLYIGAWQPWFELYSTSKKPTAGDIDTWNKSESDNRFLRYNVNTVTNSYVLSKSVDYTDQQSKNMFYSGFYRHNSTDGFRGLTMHVAHPARVDSPANSRGITFDYGGSGTKLYTYGYDANGVRTDNYKIYTEADKPTALEVNALPSSGGTMTGALIVANRKSAIVVDNQRSISFQDQSADVYHILAEGNNFKIKRGLSAEIPVFEINSSNVSMVTGLFARRGIVVQSTDGSTNMAMQSYDAVNPYISVRTVGDTADRIALTFNKGEILSNSDMITSGNFRVMNDGGLKFSSSSGFSGITWSIGVNEASRELGIHRYLNGAWQALPVIVHTDGTLNAVSGLRTSIISCSGNVAVGGSMSVAGLNATTGYMSLTSPGNCLLEFHSPGKNAVMIYKTEGGEIRFVTSNGVGGESALRMALDTGKNLTVVGGVYAPAFVQTSDIRLKSNLVKIDNPLQRCAVIDTYAYDKNGKREVGVVAQDIQRALPEAVETVHTENGDYLGVNYGSIASLAVAAINELNQQVKELRDEVEMLKAS
ncbi:pyocin knob domain-containing S74 family peptidase, partial [Aeromonas piscicola]|uniref:pyocin knob domain-containing S74 family peptidase n=1 Tax=Aeromonas piscicola TaxID=600645 RepID=UPI001427BC84